jgi:hypothetical protein
MSWLATLALTLALLQFPAGAIATFSGVFKSADKKYVVVAVENGETMRMYITRATKFIRAGKPAHASDFADGDNVDVDAERDVRMNLLAVRIEAKKPK